MQHSTPLSWPQLELPQPQSPASFFNQQQLSGQGGKRKRVSVIMESLRRAFRKLRERDTAPRNERFSQSTFERLIEQTDAHRRVSSAYELEGNDGISLSYFEKQATSGAIVGAGNTSTWTIPEEASSPEDGSLGACVYKDIDVEVEPALQESIERHNSYAYGDELATSHSASRTSPGGLVEEPAEYNDRIVLLGDWKEDFTSADSRMVGAMDGPKVCPAILPNLELITKLLEAAQRSRILAKREKRQEENEVKLWRLKAKVDARIGLMEVQCKTLEDQARQDSSNAVEVQFPILSGGTHLRLHVSVCLARKIEEHAELLEGLRDARSRINTLLKVREQAINNALRTQRRVELRVHAILDDVLVSSNLLEPEDDEPFIDPMEDTCSDIEALVADQPHTDTARNDLRTDDDEFERGHTQEEMSYEEHLFQELRDARTMLSQAQFHFDNRETYYEEDLRTYLANAANGVYIMPREEFDLHHLQEGQRFTRQLIDAEETFYELETKVKEAGITRGVDEDSCIVYDWDRDMESFDGDDGDVAQRELADWSGIEHWIASVAAAQDDGGEVPVEVDYWEADLPVQMSDSVSCIAEGYERRYIDHWRKEASLAWQN